MTLRRKLALRLAWLIVSLLVISGASLWAINGLHQDVGAAVAGYQDLRQLFDVGSHLRTARTVLGAAAPQRAQALRELKMGLDKLDLLLAAPASLSGEQLAGLRKVRSQISNALNRQRAAEMDPAAFSDDSADISAVNAALAQIADAAAHVRSAIEASQRSADAKRITTLWVIGILSAAIIAGAVGIGFWQYRGISRPLERLSRGVQTVAAGQFSERIAAKGDDEFAALAHDFNRMAGELDAFYHELEQKVAQKSHELVRSERLASVGYLAAGVAHEINNPLSIISGYAELSLRKLKDNPADNADAAKTLTLICEEAFRCKQIIEKLLALARPGEEGRRKIDLSAVAEAVVTLVRGLPQLAGRRLEQEGGREPFFILANEGEMKQVLLNLILNAIDATRPEDGKIDVELRRAAEWVELSIADNGRGMSADVLERIFEPFFTTKRGEQRGTGLGLPIAHAIIESHGGQIEAASAGQGSRFTVRLRGV